MSEPIDAVELARLRERAESQPLGLIQFSGKQVLVLLDALVEARGDCEAARIAAALKDTP